MKFNANKTGTRCSKKTCSLENLLQRFIKERQTNLFSLHREKGTSHLNDFLHSLRQI